MKTLIEKLTKTKKFSRKQCMNLKNNQFIKLSRDDHSSYHRVVTVDKLNKTVDVFGANGVITYDFSSVSYDKACELFDSLYKKSKKFRSSCGEGVSDLKRFFDEMHIYAQNPEQIIKEVVE